VYILFILIFRKFTVVRVFFVVAREKITVTPGFLKPRYLHAEPENRLRLHVNVCVVWSHKATFYRICSVRYGILNFVICPAPYVAQTPKLNKKKIKLFGWCSCSGEVMVDEHDMPFWSRIKKIICGEAIGDVHSLFLEEDLEVKNNRPVLETQKKFKACSLQLKKLWHQQT
jgi:hypothetical protein